LACCAGGRLSISIKKGETPPPGYSVCPDATLIKRPDFALREGERGCTLNSITATQTLAFTPGFACRNKVPVPACDSTTMLWLSSPVKGGGDRVVCYGGGQVQVPVYDHADPNKLWEGSTALVDLVGGTGATVHIYHPYETAAIAKDPMCH